MTGEPITLEFLARQQQRLLDEIGSMRDEMGTMRDDMQVLTAMVMRLDGTAGLVLDGVAGNAQPASAPRQPRPPPRARARRAEVTYASSPEAAPAAPGGLKPALPPLNIRLGLRLPGGAK